MPVPTRADPSRMGQFEASRHFQDRQRRNVFVRSITEHFRQKQNVLENFSGAAAMSCSCHRMLLFKFKKKALHRITDERLCSTEGAVAPVQFQEQPTCQNYRRAKPLILKRFDRSVGVFAYSTIIACLRIKHAPSCFGQTIDRRREEWPGLHRPWACANSCWPF